MKKIETIDYMTNGIYRNRKLEVRLDDENLVHFFEVGKENSDFEKEIEIDVVKWCVKNGKLPRSTRTFIPMEEGEELESQVFYQYKGKSKKITTKKVIILSESGNHCKIEDMDGNQTSVAKSQLILED